MPTQIIERLRWLVAHEHVRELIIDVGEARELLARVDAAGEGDDADQDH